MLVILLYLFCLFFGGEKEKSYLAVRFDRVLSAALNLILKARHQETICESWKIS